MDYLFISRKNVHSRYYKIILKTLGLDAQLYILGKPKLSALSYVKEAFKVDFHEFRQEQLKRKQAYSSLWRNPVLAYLYSLLLMCIERCRYMKIMAVLKEKQPKCVVLWNGKKLPNSTVELAARNLGLDIFYYENGLLPNTVSLDPKGVNFSSSLSRDPNFYLAFDPLNEYACTPPEITPRANIKKRQSFDSKTLPERFIFVPFQVPHDTQIVCYSKWISSMESFYDEVIKAVKAIHDPDLKVVFKEHPSWHKHYTELYEKDELGVFANGNSTTELIAKAEAVLTINSTVGLESLLMNKRVITLGSACYNIEGLVLHADNSEQLIECLSAAQQGWMADTVLRDKYFSYLENVYCIPRVNKDDEEHIDAVRQRLTRQDAFSTKVGI